MAEAADYEGEMFFLSLIFEFLKNQILYRHPSKDLVQSFTPQFHQKLIHLQPFISPTVDLEGSRNWLKMTVNVKNSLILLVKC